MNPIDHQLNRLFRAAAQVRSDAVPVAPYGMDTRVLAAWRDAVPLGWDMPMLVRGLILASVIMGLSLWIAASKTADPYSDYLQLADTTVQFDN